MANEKPNNLRILQSTKKTQLSPLLTACIGFFMGIAVIGAAGAAYLYQVPAAQQPAADTQEFQANHVTDMPPASATETAEANHAQPEPVLQVQTAPEQNQLHDEDSAGFDNDLINAFKHPASIKPMIDRPPVQAASQPAHRMRTPEPVVAPKPPVLRAAAAPKPAAVPLKPAAAVSEPEPEAPRGSVQMTVTKTMLPPKQEVKDPAAES